MLGRERLGLAALLAAKALVLANAFAVSVAVIWAYGLESAGTLALSSLSAAVGSLAVGFGLPSALARARLSQGGRATVGLLTSTLALVPAAGFIVAYGAALGQDRQEMAALIALGLAGSFIGQINVQQALYVLQGRLIWAPLAPAIHLVGVGAASLAPSFETFSIGLLMARTVGCAAGFVPLAYARATWTEMRTVIGDASRFAPLDLAALLGEQLPIVLLSGLLTRAELGVFGLLRQFVTVADTPGWSYLASHYPKLVKDVGAAGPALARRNEQIAWLSAGACLLAASAVALLVYQVPAVVPALPFVLLPLPGRYLNNFCDQALRAAGFVRDCAVLAGWKLALALALYGLLAGAHGFWGAVAASALLSLLSGLLYRRRFLIRFPNVLRDLRPWRMA